MTPNPTTCVLTLHYPDAKPGTPISARITNSAGQLVRTVSLRMQASSQEIDLGAEAAPGAYYISVFGANAALLGSTSVIKL